MLLALALAASGCAAALPLTLEGEAHDATLAVHAQGQLGGGDGKLAVELENRAEDAIGVDLDAIRLRAGEKGSVTALGRPQGFRRSDGGNSTRRVARGAATLAPGAKQTFHLEFERVPSAAPLALVVPSIYRLGIDGQENLRPLELPLRAEPAPPARDGKSPGGGKNNAPFFDPFVEW